MDFCRPVADLYSCLYALPVCLGPPASSEMGNEYFLESPEVVDPRINQAVWSISQMARDALAAPGAVGPGLAPGAQGGAVGTAQVQAATTAVPTATLVLGKWDGCRRAVMRQQVCQQTGTLTNPPQVGLLSMPRSA